MSRRESSTFRGAEGRKSSFFPYLFGSRDETDENRGLPVALRVDKLEKKSSDALQTGLLLAQQEEKFGTNMFDSITTEDEPELNRLLAMGLTSEEAALQLFNKKFERSSVVTVEVRFLDICKLQYFSFIIFQ